MDVHDLPCELALAFILAKSIRGVIKKELPSCDILKGVNQTKKSHIQNQNHIFKIKITYTKSKSHINNTRSHINDTGSHINTTKLHKNSNCKKFFHDSR